MEQLEPKVMIQAIAFHPFGRCIAPRIVLQMFLHCACCNGENCGRFGRAKVLRQLQDSTTYVPR